MARPLRIEFEGAVYHITSRGDGREDIYRDDEDRRQWLKLFGETCERYGWICYSYCLMSNHYHIVIETPDANLSKGMRHLNGVYTQRFNKKYNRVGHVYQGRYKSILVDKDSYLMELCRYTVLNPVRAGMVNDPMDYSWSSYHDTIGKRKGNSWLDTDEMLLYFGKKRKQAVESYIEFVSSGVQERKSIWENLNLQVYLGGEGFIKGIQDNYEDEEISHEIPKSQRTSIEEIRQRPSIQEITVGYERDEGMLKAYLSGYFTQREIAEYYGVHYVTVSRIINKLEKKQRTILC
jgi:putative transposase